MAELLIMNADNTNRDPLISAAHCYKAGDPVCVALDGHSWGRKERRSTWPDCKFLLLKIPDLTVADARKFMDSELETPTVDMIVRGDKPVIFMRRKWRFLLDAMPAAVKTALDNIGEASTKFSNVRGFIENKTTRETA